MISFQVSRIYQKSNNKWLQILRLSVHVREISAVVSAIVDVVFRQWNNLPEETNWVPKGDTHTSGFWSSQLVNCGDLPFWSGLRKQCWESPATLTVTSELSTKEDKTDCTSAQSGCCIGRWKMKTVLCYKQETSHKVVAPLWQTKDQVNWTMV